MGQGLDLVEVVAVEPEPMKLGLLVELVVMVRMEM
jgi:hypothetical protein